MGARGYIEEEGDPRQRLLRSVPPGNVSAHDINGSARGILERPDVYKSRWRSIRVMYLTMFLSSVSFSICMSSLYPYLKVLDPTATTNFLGWVVAAYSVGQLLASPFFGAWSTCRNKSREPIVVSLIINVFANVLYMYLESMSHHKASFLVVARAFVGFGAGNVAVVRSYVSGATTLGERTPAMANMSAFQAIGFIIGPVIQTAMVPIGYPGPVHVPGFHLDMYTSTALLSALVGIVNIVLLVVVFKEHRVPDAILIPDIQSSDTEVSEEVLDAPLDYLAVISSIILFFCVLFIFAVFETISTPLSMHMFAWSKSQATLYIGLMLGGAGIVSIVVFVFIKILSKRFNERYLLFGGFIICLLGFIIYLPWGSHYPDIQYAGMSTPAVMPSNSTSFPTEYTDFTSAQHSTELSFSVGPYAMPAISKTLSNKKVIYRKKNNHYDQDSVLRFIQNNPKERVYRKTNSIHDMLHHLAIDSLDVTLTTDYITSQPTTCEQHTTDIVLTTEPTVETSESSPETTIPITSSQETTTVHKETTTLEPTTTEHTTHKTTIVTTETSTVTTSKQTTSQETTTVHDQTTNTEAQTTEQTTTVHEQTTNTEAPTTEQTTVANMTTEPMPNITTTAHSVENTTAEAVGCPYYYDWCFDTPSILLWQFLLGTFFIAVGYPTCNVMSYAIYSKILGPKPQGVWMGWLTAAGSLARCLGPVFVSQVYDAYGPRVTFISMCVLTVLTIAGFIAVCRRLVPFRVITITV